MQKTGMEPLFHPAIKRLHFFFGYALIEKETRVGNGIFASDSNVVPIRKRSETTCPQKYFCGLFKRTVCRAVLSKRRKKGGRLHGL